MALDWDVLNVDCSDISGWTDSDTGTGVSSQTTYDSRSTFKFSLPNADDSTAARYKAVSIPDTFTCEVVINNVNTNGFGWYFDLFTTSKHRYIVRIYNYSFAIYHSSTAPNYTDAFVVPFDGSGSPTGAENGGIVGNWVTVRLVVKSSRKADIWVNDRCYLQDITCDLTHATISNRVQLVADGASGSSTGAAESYLDLIRIDTTPEAPTTNSAFKINGQDIMIRTAHKTSWEYNTTYHTFPQYNLKIRGTDALSQEAVCDVTTVGVSDTNASKIRIWNGSADKCLAKLPS